MRGVEETQQTTGGELDGPGSDETVGRRCQDRSGLSIIEDAVAKNEDGRDAVASLRGHLGYFDEVFVVRKCLMSLIVLLMIQYLQC